VPWGFVEKNGASEGIRTLDTHVGNVMLYQAELRSLPNSLPKLKEAAGIASPVFTFSRPGCISVPPAERGRGRRGAPALP
jgi:hypothetical protein